MGGPRHTLEHADKIVKMLRTIAAKKPITNYMKHKLITGGYITVTRDVSNGQGRPRDIIEFTKQANELMAAFDTVDNGWQKQA